MADTDSRSLEVQTKREIDQKEESTVPARYYVPFTDIYETDEALTVVMEMPGVEKDRIDVNVQDQTLTVEGQIDFSSYTEMQPLYTEYNVGHYRRQFSLSGKVDQDKISAQVDEGVLTLTLPKAEAAKPRRIEIG